MRWPSSTAGRPLRISRTPIARAPASPAILPPPAAPGRPAGVAVLVSQFGGFLHPAVSNAACFDHLIFFARVALFGRGDQVGLDHLPPHGDRAGRPKRAVEPIKQSLDDPRPGEFRAKPPDRARRKSDRKGPSPENA